MRQKKHQTNIQEEGEEERKKEKENEDDGCVEEDEDEKDDDDEDEEEEEKDEDPCKAGCPNTECFSSNTGPAQNEKQNRFEFGSAEN